MTRLSEGSPSEMRFSWRLALFWGVYLLVVCYWYVKLVTFLWSFL